MRERHKALASSVLWERGENRDLPIMAVILSLFAMTFANSGPRKGRYAGLFPAILVYIIYSNLLGVSRAWISKGILSPAIGAVWVHLLMFTVLMLILNKHKIHRYWVHYLSKKETA